MYRFTYLAEPVLREKKEDKVPDAVVESSLFSLYLSIYLSLRDLNFPLQERRARGVSLKVNPCVRKRIGDTRGRRKHRPTPNCRREIRRKRQ